MSNANDEVNLEIKIGDVLYHCWGAYAHRTHEFAQVIKITPTGKIRIQMLNKIKVQENGDDTIVKPGDQLQPKTKLISKNRTYGQGTIAELWYFYKPDEVYTDHFDRWA